MQGIKKQNMKGVSKRRECMLLFFSFSKNKKFQEAGEGSSDMRVKGAGGNRLWFSVLLLCI
jgi:hypothetical protein